MRFILFLFLITFNASCDSPSLEDNIYLPNADVLAAAATTKTFAQLKKEKGLYPCGIGSGGKDKIRMLALSFNYYNEVNIKKARELLMDAGTIFLNIINSNEKIHPFLENSPFKPDNIEIRIFLYNSKGLETEPEKLTTITMIDGVLKYKAKILENEHIMTVYEETYEEAAAKLGIDINSQLSSND